MQNVLGWVFRVAAAPLLASGLIYLSLGGCQGSPEERAETETVIKQKQKQKKALEHFQDIQELLKRVP